MKKVLFVLVPLILIGGTVVGFALTGKVVIPGLTPKRFLAQKANPAAPPVSPNAKKDEKVAKETKKPEKKEKQADPQQGNAALAKLWNSIDAEQLSEIVANWKTNELAQVMIHMEPSKQAELLSTVKPNKASELSRAIQKLSAGS